MSTGAYLAEDGLLKSSLRGVAENDLSTAVATRTRLVLYQNFGGKAWIAAEELSVPRLASDGGVGYFVSWINARFLDVEVASAIPFRTSFGDSKKTGAVHSGV